MDACITAAKKKQQLTNMYTRAGSMTSVANVPATTIVLSGSRKIFKIPPCNASGTYLDRNVPATGMKSPTQNSTTTKLTMTRTRHPPGTFGLDKHSAGIAMLMLDSRYTNDADASVATAVEPVKVATKCCRGGNTRPPIVILIMRAEKTHPVGTPPGGSNCSSVGTHMNTNYSLNKAVR
jgi:hypothetical protein